MVASGEPPRPQKEGQRMSVQQALKQAHQSWRAGQGRQAEDLCLKILAAAPRQPEALHLMGLIAHGAGRLDMAIGYIERACEAPQVPAIFLSNLAEMCRQAGRLEEGEKAARRAVAINPKLAGAWSNLGIILQEQGKLDESADCLERALALEPDSAETHNNLANTRRKQERLTEAENHWTRALALKPDYPEALSNQALLLVEQQKLDEAAANCRRAINLNPRLPDAYVNLAAVETAREHHLDALRCLDALMNVAPDNFAGLTARALTLKQLDKLDEAFKVAQRAVAVRPQNPEAHNTLGLVLQAQGRYDDAMAAFDKAATMAGGATEKARLNQALLMAEFGRLEELQEAFDKVVKEFPNSAPGWFNRADGRKFQAGDPDIEAMETLLASEETSSKTSKMILHFALGKAYLDAGEF